MRGRLAPTALVLLGGWLLSLWGLAALERVFVQERADALADLERRKQALSLYAEASLRERVGLRMDEAARRMARAVDDPLESAQGLALVDEGGQRLPRMLDPLPGTDTPAADLFEALRGGRVPLARGEGPWAERLVLFRDFEAALREDRPEAVERAVRQALAHRLRFRIDVTRELPYWLALLDLLSTKATPDPALMRGILRHGMSDGQGGNLEDLTRMLLEHRNRFTSPDFEALVEVLADLSERAGISARDLRARASERPTSPMKVPSGREIHPGYFGFGWFIENTGDFTWRGMELELGTLLDEIAEEMRGRGLIEPSATVVRAEPGPSLIDFVPLDLALEIRSDRWISEARLHEQRFRLKTALVALSALLGGVLVALAIALQRRRLRWVEMRADFVSAVTHELRTPLASIRLMAETLDRRLAGAPEARDYPRRIVRAADGLAGLVDNILSFNRLEKERWHTRPESVELSALVEPLAQELRDEAPRGLEIDLAALHGVEVRGDPELLRMLFANLLRNALVYNARDPIRVALDARREGDRWVLGIRDNGWGIAREERERVFEDFGRGREAQRRAVPGTGLGLAICRRVVELHGGRIQVAESSEAGTLVELSLPVASGTGASP